MTPVARRRLHTWYGVALSVLTAVVAILFIYEAADIYYSGLSYGRELVGQRLLTVIAAPGILWILAVIAGGIIWIVVPEENKKLKRLPDERADLNKLYAMAGESQSEEYLRAKAAVDGERKVRRIVWLCYMGSVLICAGVALYYILDLHSYPSNPNKAVLRLVASVLPCAAVAFAACCAATIFDAVSAKKVLPHARTMLKLGGRAQGYGQPAESKKFDNFCIAFAAIKIVLICLAVAGIGVTIYYAALEVMEVKFVHTIFNSVLPPLLSIIFLMFAASDLEISEQYASNNKKLINILCLISRIAIVVTAVVFIVCGILNKGANDVFIKGIKICMECIGMG